MRCPVCRAENREPPQCRRCKADLTLLWEMHQQHETLLSQAQAQAVAGNGEQVVELIEAANELRRDSKTLPLLAIGQLLRRDFKAALRIWRQIQSETSNN